MENELEERIWSTGYGVSSLVVSRMETSWGAGWISYEEDVEEAT